MVVFITLFTSSTAERRYQPGQLNTVNQRREEPVGNGAWRLNCLTPVSSPIRGPKNKSGSKSCNATPRQSQLGGSVREKVAAKNRASPSTPRMPIPSRSIMRRTGAVVGAGHNLASPICLLSSSPVASVQGRRQTPEQIKPGASLSHVRKVILEHHSPDLVTKELKSTPATNSMGSVGNMLIRETTIKACDRQVENIASSSAQHVVLDKSQKSRRKRLADEGPCFTSVSSKKRRRTASTVDRQPGITLHEINDVGVSSAVSSKETMGSKQESQIPSEGSLIPTERENLALKRMDIAQQLANSYPHLAAPSYEKTRAKQLAKLKKKDLRRAGAESISTKQKPVQTRTIFSFETVDDDDGGMDWSRSKQLADDLRDAVANGRKPALPLLKCAQSSSPSP